MREVLARFNDQRIAIRATVLREGAHTRPSSQRFATLLLGQVQTPEGLLLCEHAWVYYTAALRALALQPGDVLQCTARVRRYQKGFLGAHAYRRSPSGIDYTFEHLDTCVCVYRSTLSGQEVVYDEELC